VSKTHVDLRVRMVLPLVFLFVEKKIDSSTLRQNENKDEDNRDYFAIAEYLLKKNYPRIIDLYVKVEHTFKCTSQNLIYQSL